MSIFFYTFPKPSLEKRDERLHYDITASICKIPMLQDIVNEDDVETWLETSKLHGRIPLFMPASHA